MPCLYQGERKGERGFTLMELLIALTLFAVLMTALVGGLGFGARVWEKSDDRLEARSQLDIVHGFLRQRLEEALPASEVDEAARRQPLFSGEPERLRLASFMPDSLGEGIFLLELSLRRRPGDEETSDLILRWRPWPEASAQDVGERVILDDVDGLDIAYFGADEGQATATWRDRWQERPLLPALIRIDLQFSAGDGRRWRPLVVSPMVDEWYDTSY